ncbi:MAG TPA: hypothetical protein DCZ10_06480 [Pelotomaculum sp.]|nr:hypothetical protein [Pelotomaculum sp.]
MLYNHVKYKGPDVTAGASALDGFNDAGNNLRLDKEAVRWAIGAGSITGRDDAALVPRVSPPAPRSWPCS